MKIFLVLSLLLTTLLFGKGVKAGTVITNIATLDYKMGDKDYHTKSNIQKSVVAQLIDVKVSWLDAQDITVVSGDKKRALVFKVLNSGNGVDRFNLIKEYLEHKSDFKPERSRVFLDINKNYYLDSHDRVRKTVTLQPDDEQLVFIVCDIGMQQDTQNDEKAYYSLKAVSRKGGSGVSGIVHRKKGVKKVDAIDGLSGGIGEDEGDYKFLKATLILQKSVEQDDDENITVTLDISVDGEGAVKNVKIVDEIPDETIYIKNSLKLNDISLTDKKDGDEGRYKRRYKNKKAKIFFNLGDMDVMSHYIAKYRLRVR